MQQSWLAPFWPLFEQTEAKFLEPLALTTPEDRSIKSFFLASLAIASAASLPPQTSELFPLLNDLTIPLNMDERCPITSAIQFHQKPRFQVQNINLPISLDAMPFRGVVLKILKKVELSLHYIVLLHSQLAKFFYILILSYEPGKG